MITLSENQVVQRRDSLPDSLLTALCSDETTNIIWSASEAEKVPDEKIYTISKVAGWVLMGLLRPEDFTQELKDRIDLDPQSGAKIQAALNEKLFLPLKADIDKTNQPAGTQQQPAVLSTAAVPPATDAQTMKDIAATTPAAPVAATPVPAPVVPAGPAPVMLQGTATSKTLQKNIDFHLSKPNSGAEMSLETSRPKSAAMPAMIEFSGSGSAIPKPPTAPAGAVHYTEFKTPTMPSPVAASTTRTVTEVTSAAPTIPVATQIPAIKTPATATPPISTKPPAAATPTMKVPTPTIPSPAPAPMFMSSTPKPPQTQTPVPTAVPIPQKPPIATIPTPMPPKPPAAPDVPNAKVIVRNFP